MRLKGTVTALVTPFIDQQLDEEGLACNIRYQIEQGVDGIFCLGTTGESCTLSDEEQARVISVTVNEAKGRVPVWVGTGSNSTREAIEKTKRAKELGADVALVVAPYYNKPSQEGIYRHFESIATAVEIPVIIYNIPGRCGVNIEPGTLMQIAELPNIIGVKDSSGNIDQAGEILHAKAQRHPDFLVFSGDDALTLPIMVLGGDGVVSVVSNLIPDRVAALVNAAMEGEFALARKLHYQLLPLFNMAFIETNPVPIKAAMEICGMPSGGCRLPLCRIASKHQEKLRNLLAEMGLAEMLNLLLTN